MSDNTKTTTVAERNAADPAANMIRALLEERRGAQIRGKADQVKGIDAELSRLGYKEPKKARPAAGERAAAAHLDASDDPQVQAGAGDPDDHVDDTDARAAAGEQEQAAAERESVQHTRAARRRGNALDDREAKPRSRRGRGAAQVDG